MQTTIPSPQKLAGENISADTPDLAHPWMPDQGDGTYCNPVLHADYSDPDAIRVGDDFFLTASSLNCTPGLPILHSKDLVSWTIIGHALKNLPHPRYEKVQSGCGVWAPAIRFHAGKHWIFYPTPDEGIFLVTANHPAGSWSEPHCVQEGKGLIDSCPLWDDDGKAYLVHAYAGSRVGIKHPAARLSDGTGRLKATGRRRSRFSSAGKTSDARRPKISEERRMVLHPCARRWRGKRLAGGAALKKYLRTLRRQNRPRSRRHGHQRPASGRVGGRAGRRLVVPTFSGCGRLRAHHPPTAG